MITIEFNYGQMITIIQANLSDPFQIPLNKFAQKTLIPLNSVNFLANGLTIKPENTRIAFGKRKDFKRTFQSIL